VQTCNCFAPILTFRDNPNILVFGQAQSKELQREWFIIDKDSSQAHTITRS
jgi:hypothetical protein